VSGLSTACLTKNWPTGPSRGVKGSLSPQATSMGQRTLDTSSQGLGPAGPAGVQTCRQVTMQVRQAGVDGNIVHRALQSREQRSATGRMQGSQPAGPAQMQVRRSTMQTEQGLLTSVVWGGVSLGFWVSAGFAQICGLGL
jgi:hypothetical protein